MTHFRDALRLEPDLEWARAGIVESLKAKNVVYRLMLRYFLWSARLSGQAQWGIMVGGFVGYQVLRSMARDRPATAPFVWPVLIAYVAFAIGTWLADPLFNLLLRFNRFGRLALSKRQTWASNVLAGLLLLAAGTAAAGLAGVAGGGPSDGFGWYALAIVFGLLTVPAMGCFRLAPGWPTKAMVAGTLALAAIGLSSGVGWFVVDRMAEEGRAEADAESRRMAEEFVESGWIKPRTITADDLLGKRAAAALAVVRGLQNVFVLGFVASQFGYNYLRGVEPKK
jgi:hypothetical protein